MSRKSTALPRKATPVRGKAAPVRGRATPARGKATRPRRGNGVRGPGPLVSLPRGAGGDGNAPRLHVAIIMDGSGRWAESHGRPRLDGHRAGAETVRGVVAAAPRFGIGTLTLFAFSSDNWKRPRFEVQSLMALVRDFLLDFCRSAVTQGTRVDVIGRRDRLSGDLLSAIEQAETQTRHGRTLHLRLAIDYSAREAIVRAAGRFANPNARERGDFLQALAQVCHASVPAPDVDLLIRTGGEQRLSDFLLWECAYAELYFTTRMWPEFQPDDLRSALAEFRTRERRFGRLPQP